MPATCGIRILGGFGAYQWNERSLLLRDELLNSLYQLRRLFVGLLQFTGAE